MKINLTRNEPLSFSSILETMKHEFEILVRLGGTCEIYTNFSLIAWHSVRLAHFPLYVNLKHLAQFVLALYLLPTHPEWSALPPCMCPVVLQDTPLVLTKGKFLEIAQVLAHPSEGLILTLHYKEGQVSRSSQSASSCFPPFPFPSIWSESNGLKWINLSMISSNIRVF